MCLLALDRNSVGSDFSGTGCTLLYVHAVIVSLVSIKVNACASAEAFVMWRFRVVVLDSVSC